MPRLSIDEAGKLLFLEEKHLGESAWGICRENLQSLEQRFSVILWRYGSWSNRPMTWLPFTPTNKLLFYSYDRQRQGIRWIKAHSLWAQAMARKLGVELLNSVFIECVPRRKFNDKTGRNEAYTPCITLVSEPCLHFVERKSRISWRDSLSQPNS